MKKEKKEVKEEEIEVLKRKRKVIIDKNLKYFVFWLVKQGETYEVLRRKRIKPTNESVSYASHNHHIDIGNPTYRTRNKRYYFVDLDGGQLFVEGVDIKYDPQIVYEFVDRKIIQQLATNLTSSQWKLNIFLAIFSAIFGGLIGFIMAGGSIG